MAKLSMIPGHIKLTAFFYLLLGLQIFEQYAMLLDTRLQFRIGCLTHVVLGPKSGRW